MTSKIPPRSGLITTDDRSITLRVFGVLASVAARSRGARDARVRAVTSVGLPVDAVTAQTPAENANAKRLRRKT